MNRLIFAIMVLFYGFLRGTEQAIVMHFPNPRDHWRYEYYHRLDILKELTLILIGIRLYLMQNSITFMYIMGVSILLWEVTEFTYYYTRYRKSEFDGWFPNYENFFGTGLYLNRPLTRILHVSRLVAGTTLIIGGIS